MPYTQEEAQRLTFYTNFRDDLREEYLIKVKDSSDLSTPFRDDNNVLLSYENIENNEGIETVTINDESLYKLYTTQENIEQSKTFSNRLQAQYDKTKLLNNIIERDITELSEDIIADELPSDISNGMVVTTEDPTDKTRFLIQGFQKRIFRNLGEFYARGFTLGKLKSLSQEELDSIPDGDPIE